MTTTNTIKPAIVWLVASFSVWSAVAVLRAAINVTHGLRAEYFSNDRRAGTPVLSVVDPEVSTARIAHNWLDDSPGRFSARWTGYLAVGEPGLYTFATTSDDGSSLAIDGRVVVDNGGQHGAVTKTGQVQLERGPHAVLIDYVQAGGLYEMNWSWAREGGRLSTVPASVLSTRRLDARRLVLARVLDWLKVAAGAWVVLAGVWAAFRYGPMPWRDSVRRYPRLACLALFIALSVVETWPLASHPSRLSRNDNGDTILNEWVLAWVAHQAPRAPLHLYDANIFHPEPDTLAYSEALIVQSAMGAPLLWLGASPVLTYNLVLLAGFALTGWAMCLVAVRWTGDWAAGLAAGILLAFNAHTLTSLPHLQTQHAEFLPPTLMALDTLLREPRIRAASRLALWFTLQALTSVYMLVFTAVAMAAGTLARPEAWRGGRIRSVSPCAALAAGLAAILLLPFMWPYWRAYHDLGLSRSLEDATRFSASWRDYLTTPGRLHYVAWSHRWFSPTALFPGAAGLALAGIALVRGGAWKDARARMCLAFGVCGVVLSFGAHVQGYAALYQVLPPLQAIRAVSRFGYLGIVAVAALGAFGMVEIRRLVPDRRWPPLSFLLLTLLVLEPLAAPLPLVRFDGIPPIYERLRAEPQAVVVEIPFYEPRYAFGNAPYMLNSTLHWRPLLNGHSGFLPASYRRHYDALSEFPDARSLATLRAEGVSHVFVHVDDMTPQMIEIVDGTPALHKIAADGDIVLYRLDGSNSRPSASDR